MVVFKNETFQVKTYLANLAIFGLLLIKIGVLSIPTSGLTGSIRPGHTDAKMATLCGDTLYCDVTELEAICQDVLDEQMVKTNDILGRRKRSVQ